MITYEANVICDTCENLFQRPFPNLLVTPPRERMSPQIARAIARVEGWRHVQGKDICPKCRQDEEQIIKKKKS